MHKSLWYFASYRNMLNSKIKIVEAHLFSAPDSVSLAHCVSADFAMKSGIAREFKQRYGGIEELKNQKVQLGGCAFMTSGTRFVYHLVSKNRYFEKPYETIEQTLYALLKATRTHQVKELALPIITCGRDQLNWERVEKFIHKVFSENCGVQITIYKWDPSPN